MSIVRVGNDCCGCRTCQQVCKFQAIQFSNNENGFEMPYVDNSMCTKCNACEKVCPALHMCINSDDFSYGGICYAKDERIKHGGSSGGLFGVFANAIIEKRGVVFGAAFDNGLHLRTTKAETIEQLVPLYKSKYLLCDTNDSFDSIKSRLERGQFVLYCSSPCQISALKLYLKKEYPNLLLIDFICHGVGSQALFDKSIDYIEIRDNIQIIDFMFRYKGKKVSSHEYKMSIQKKSEVLEKNNLYYSFPYYYAYCKQLVCRDSCYNCKYATQGRSGDITIGDFHTIHKYNPKIDRFGGVSMILINTAKGKKWFDECREKFYFEELDKEILYENNRFSAGQGNISDEVVNFRNDLNTHSFDFVVKKYLMPRYEWKKIIYYKLPNFIKRIVKKVLGI